jgi:hypothetical protein
MLASNWCIPSKLEKNQSHIPASALHVSTLRLKGGMRVLTKFSFIERMLCVGMVMFHYPIKFHMFVSYCCEIEKKIYVVYSCHDIILYST